jgi:N-acyl-D-amino-acid deacylase
MDTRATYELILRNATIIDGTGAPSRPGDVGVSGDRISAVGRLRGRGEFELDCSGLHITPGFIDIHSHSDFSIFENPQAPNYVTQGVTLLVSGNCGFSGGPVDLQNSEILAMFAGEEDLVKMITWSDMTGYLAVLERLPKAINVATLIGHGNVRASVLGLGDRTPTAADLDRMGELVREGMEAGAFGLSTGLIYAPGVFSRTDELIALARVAADYGGLYVTHMRNESDLLLDAVREAAEIGLATGARVQISHHKVSGRRNRGLVRTALDLQEDYRRRGLEVTCDVYPCTAGATGLGALLPSWAHAGGREGCLALLRDAAGRERLRRELSRPSLKWQNLLFDAGFEGVFISDSKVFPEHLGKSLAEVAREGVAGTAAPASRDPYGVLFDLLQRDPEIEVVVRGMDEDDVRYVLRHRLSMVCDDAGVVARGDGCPHPRAYRAFTRVLATYARDEKLLTLEEAVHKMTGMPAWKLGLPDRGVVREGARADLAVFDLWGLNSASDFGDPHHLAEGMVHVTVGGRFVLRDGRPTGETPGEVVRRPV